MPFRDPDLTDPNILVGVMLPAGAETQREMAYVFAEEFARMGHDRKSLLNLFQRDPIHHRRVLQCMGTSSIFDFRFWIFD